MTFPRVTHAILWTAAGTALVISCAAPIRGDVILGTRDDAGAVTAFTPTADASTIDASAELTSYCPSNKCPAGYTNCPSSRFPCDVNLLTDRNNCGACGAACPTETAREGYECVDGQCVLNCKSKYLDCDGIPDNGCESMASSNDSCGWCGTQCTDPNAPCLVEHGINYRCGCSPGLTYCASGCVDIENDDTNCGECSHRCHPLEGKPPLPPNMYYGCKEGECGAPKCGALWGNCDGLIENGCEVRLNTSQDCGTCGNACSPDQTCRQNSSYKWECACPPGKTWCTDRCVDVAADALNCGACGRSCRTKGETAVGSCKHGTCAFECVVGRGDCNGDLADECEVNTASDPRNCGGCGIVCDAVAGQACVGGRCVVEPCDRINDDAGGPN